MRTKHASQSTHTEVRVTLAKMHSDSCEHARKHTSTWKSIHTFHVTKSVNQCEADQKEKNNTD